MVRLTGRPCMNVWSNPKQEHEENMLAGPTESKCEWSTSAYRLTASKTLSLVKPAVSADMQTTAPTADFVPGHAYTIDWSDRC